MLLQKTGRNEAAARENTTPRGYPTSPGPECPPRPPEHTGNRGRGGVFGPATKPGSRPGIKKAASSTKK